MATDPDLHMAETATGQSRQQMFDGGHLAGAQIQRGAQLTVAHLIWPQLDRLLYPRQTHMEPRLIRRSKLYPRRSSTVEANARA